MIFGLQSFTINILVIHKLEMVELHLHDLVQEQNNLWIVGSKYYLYFKQNKGNNTNCGNKQKQQKRK